MNKRNGKQKVRFQNISLLLGSILVALFLGEILLRAYDHLTYVPTFEYSSIGHHRLVPNVCTDHTSVEFSYTWENNSLGMRDRERSSGKKSDSFRILFLGDSMVQGWGVPLEKSMTALLEKSLNKPLRKKTIEVINAGVFGYSPFLEHLYLKELMPVLKPDMVIVGLFLQNDIGDDYFYSNEAKTDKGGSYYFSDNDQWPWSKIDSLTSERMNSIYSKNSLLHLILKNSRLARFFSDLLMGDSQHKKLIKQYQIMRQISKENREDIQINLGLVNFPVLNKQSRLSYWRITLNALDKIKELCIQSNAQMVLVVIPGEGTADFNEPHEVISDFAKDISIPLIELKQEFLNHPKNVKFPKDEHWNYEGHRLAAEIIDKELRQKMLLPLP